MEKSWSISGAYADWTLTLSIDPPQVNTEYESTESETVDWPHAHADRIARYFDDIVNFYESTQELNNCHGRSYGLSAMSAS
ncbi:MAG: hypothetical protein ACRDQ5_05575 [Sciscionella sp.]